MNYYAEIYAARPRMNLRDMLTERPQPLAQPSRIIRDFDSMPGPVHYDRAEDERLVYAVIRAHGFANKLGCCLETRLPAARVRNALGSMRKAGRIVYDRSDNYFKLARTA